MADLTTLKIALDNKPVAVFGLGLSGLSAVRALVNAGISVIAYDDKEENRDKAQQLGAVIEDLTAIPLEGYACLVLAPGVPYTFEPHPVVVNAQKYNVEIIGDIELFYRCGHNIKTIGITGTNGKSTTTALMTHVLKENNIHTVMGGNIGKAIFDVDVSSPETVLVLELSSYQLDLCPTFRPDFSVLLNITADHLDRHGSMDAYVGAKAKILEGQGEAIIDVDDDFTQELFNQAFFNGERHVTPISVVSQITEGYFAKDGKIFQNIGGEDVAIGDLNHIERLQGHHNHQNALAVFVVATLMGLANDGIFKSFESFSGLPHRQYIFEKNGNITFVNDSKATNAEAAAKALSSFNNIYWILGGRAKEGGLSGLEVFRDKIKMSYLVGEAEENFSEWLKAHHFSHKVCHVLERAIQEAYKDALDAGEESVILLSPACASWDQFSSFEKRGEFFEDEVSKLMQRGA